MKKLHILLVALLFIVGIFAIPVRAAAPDAVMIVTNPAEDMEHAIQVAWHTQLTGTFVEYTLASDVDYASSQTKVGVCTPYTFDTYTSTIYQYNQCQVILDGLESNTTYQYRVGLTNMSGNYYFTTAGSNQFSFIHMTDIHSYAPIPARVTTANSVLEKLNTMANDVRFTLISGDSVAYGSYYDQWQALFSMSIAQKMPLAMTPGNHCYYTGSATAIDDRFFNAVTFNPQNGAVTSENATYYFTYNNTLFISLDSESSTASLTNLNYQKEWFKNVVLSNPSDFIVVYTHRPFYTGDGLNASQASTMRLNWQSLFDDCGVDLVLSGHNHVYARTHQVYRGSTTVTSGQGAVYITGTQIGDRYVTDPGTPMTQVAKAIVGKQDAASLITIGADTITLQFINLNGTVLDTATLVKKEFVLNKSTFESSIQLQRNINTPQQATLQFANTQVAQIKRLSVITQDEIVLGQIDFPASKTSLTLTNIPLDRLNVNCTLEITYKDGSITQQPLTISNAKFQFGTISHLRIKQYGADAPEFHWTSDLKNDRIERFDVYVNGVLFGQVPANQHSIALTGINRYQEQAIELRAIDVDGDRMYRETFIYGSNGVFQYMNDSATQSMRDLIQILKANR